MLGREGHARWAAETAFALTVAMALGAAAFGVADHGTPLPKSEGGQIGAFEHVLFALMAVAYGALGTLLARRRPENPIGWMLCLAALALTFTGVVGGWYLHTEYVDPGSLPLASGLVWAANWAWVPGFVPLLTLVLLLFPGGRPPTQRWRPVAGLALLAMAMLIVGYGLAPGPLEDYPRTDNPLGVGGEVAGDLQFIGFAAFSLSAILSMASLVVRFRRSSGIERQQVRWMAAAATLTVFAWLASSALDQGFGIDVTGTVLPIVQLALPAAAAVAVLRYRLYDLDLVIRRTLVYAVLTATLGGCYLGLVLLISLAVGESDLAIAASTLAVAALVAPARRRIQSLVDRRFFRRRYDAAQTVERFSARLRDQVELDALSGELRAVARETMQPAHVSLWLRPEAGR